MQKRSSFSGKLGFVLAAAGSAVGLGNIWRFPYLAAKYGGGTFLFIYLILAVTFGFTLMTAEIAIGRKTGLSAIGAFTILDKRFKFLGILASAVPIIIFPYYSVIGGWVVKILFRICHWFRSHSSGRQLFYRFHWRNIRTDRMVFLVYCSYSSYRWFWCRAGYRKGQQIHDADPRSSDSVRCLIWTDDRRCHGRTFLLSETTYG